MADELTPYAYDDYTRQNLGISGLPINESATRPRRFLRDRELPYLPANESATRPPHSRELPYNAHGLASLQVRDMPYLEGTNALGFVFSSNDNKKRDANRRADQTIFVRPSANSDTVAHEAEHLMARQGLGDATLTRDKFKELLGNDWKTQWKGTSSFLNGLLASAPYLKEKYGIDNYYTTPKFIMEQGETGLYEILATLAGTESAQRTDLTKDPELRKTLFKDKNVREAYNAVTGLRQTRLDARDLPPYTRQPEVDENKTKNDGILKKITKSLGFQGGGRVRDI
jgi:hypothetical protein